MFLVTVLECFKTDAISRNCSRASYIGIGEIVRFFEAFVSEPEDVEA
jgi:hypothetical protein